MPGRNVRVEGVRQRNLAEVLRLLHREGPLSRARLTERTELNRSTIADLVATLADAGLADEREPDPTRQVGRPSPVVAVSPDVIAIAVNPEVDAITVGAVGLDGRLLERERHEVDDVPTLDDTASIVGEIVARWRGGALAATRFVRAGVAVPGLVRAGDGVVRFAPHLGWRELPVAAVLAEATGMQTVVGNDATLGAHAEHLFGAARGRRDVVYLNGGAGGIGGGLIIGDVLVGGAGGYAGEWGQNRPGILDAADRRAGDGVLEDEVNRARLLAAVGLAVADEPTLAAALAAATDPAVAAEVARQRRILATALTNAVNVLNPSVIVLGGFLATIGEPDLAALLASVRAQALAAPAADVELTTAALGEDRLLIGAAELAFAALLEDPLTVMAAAAA